MHLVHSISLKNVSLLFSFSLSLPLSLSGCTRQQGLTQLSTASTVPDLFAPRVYIYIYILTHIVFLLSCVAQWIEPKLKTLLCCLYCLSLQLRSFSESWLSLVFGASVPADLHWFFFSIWNRWDTSCPAWTDVWGFIFSHSLCTKWPLKW